MGISVDEKRWQAESDAHSLIRAAEVNADKTRLKSAKVAAKKMAADAKKQLTAVLKVAKKAPKKTVSKTSSKRKKK